MSTSVRPLRAISRLRGCWSTPRRAAATGSLSGAILAAAAIALVAMPAAGAAVHPAAAPVKGTILSVTNIPSPVLTAGPLQPARRLPSASYSFVSHVVTKTIPSKSTQVVITGSVDIGSSVLNELATGALSVCAQRAPSGNLRPAVRVEPEIVTTIGDEFFAQSTSGVLTGLSHGKYRFGLCMANRSSNVVIGFSTGTVMLIAG
jgi:hypothetical protein